MWDCVARALLSGILIPEFLYSASCSSGVWGEAPASEPRIFRLFVILCVVLDFAMS